MKSSRTIEQWVDYMQTLHGRSIDLSLERVDAVAKRLLPEGPSYQVITIAGTNGKGSTAELISSILTAAGLRVGKYTSPHLLTFNERFTVDGAQSSDSELGGALAQVESARGEVPLTFFEFGTLAAILLFESKQVDYAVMEVGLGGRLDAVNILEPVMTVVTNVSLDHTAWLGNTVDEIAAEKIAITRERVHCVIGMLEPPEVMLKIASQRKAIPSLIGSDFYPNLSEDQKGDYTWVYKDETHLFEGLPLPFAQGGHQLHNAATAVRAVTLLNAEINVTPEVIKQGLQNARLSGRCQILATQPLILADVSHNTASVAALSERLKTLPVTGKQVALCGMLADKDVKSALAEVSSQIDCWYLVSIDHERGSRAVELAKIASSLGVSKSQIETYDNAKLGFEAVLKTLNSDDCLIVFGSFYVVGDILALILELQNG